MSDTIDLSGMSGNGLEQAAVRLKEGRIEDGDREMLATALSELLPLREQLGRLQAELEETRQALAQLKREQTMIVAERDQYLRSLYALLPREWYDVSEEQIEAQMREGGVTFEEIMKGIEDATRD